MSTGPFIVRHLRSPFPLCASCGKVSVSRGEMTIVSAQAVADLDEARRFAHALVDAVPTADAGEAIHCEQARREIDALDVTGDRISVPGSEIHVEAKTWTRLAEDVGDDSAPLPEAWNRRFGVAAQEKEGER